MATNVASELFLCLLSNDAKGGNSCVCIGEVETTEEATALKSWENQDFTSTDASALPQSTCKKLTFIIIFSPPHTFNAMRGNNLTEYKLHHERHCMKC